MKGKILICVVAICLGFLLFSLLRKEPSRISVAQQANIEAKLSCLSDYERTDLENLFGYLFYFDQCSYPLFGSKPMSIGRLLEDEHAVNGWAAWKKIAPGFNSEQFVVNDYVYNGKTFVLIANLELVEKVYKENKVLFDEAFNGCIGLEALKSCLRERNELFEELLGNDLVLGLLLGYGAKNAQLYCEKSMLLKPFSSGHPLNYAFSKIMPPCFACDPNSEETLELKNRYKREREQMVQMARREDLFKQMLVLLNKSS